MNREKPRMRSLVVPTRRCILKRRDLQQACPKCYWKVPPERVRAPSDVSLLLDGAPSESRVVWECSPKREVNPF